MKFSRSFDKVERYEILTEDNVQQLPVVTYEHIYQFCCRDNMSFNALDWAHKHKDAGDISDVKLSKVCYMMMTFVS